MIKVFELEWKDELGQAWMNIFNLELCLFSPEHTNKDLLKVKEIDISKTSVNFICKCGMQQGWIIDGEITQPCPKCGRKYIGKYNPQCLTIDALEIITP